MATCPANSTGPDLSARARIGQWLTKGKSRLVAGLSREPLDLQIAHGTSFDDNDYSSAPGSHFNLTYSGGHL